MSTNPLGINNNSEPAYDGAQFDKSGYCLKHPMVRLCKPVQNSSTSQSLLSPDNERVQGDIKYAIICKICHMCEEHSLQNERKPNAQVSVWLLLNEYKLCR